MNPRRIGTFLLAAAVGLALAASITFTAGAQGWVCPPCGDAHDEKVYDEPGACPVCGMKLMAQDEANARRKDRMSVAILLFDGVQIIDYTGPYEVFGQGGIFDVYTVSETGAPLMTAMGMHVTPAHSFVDTPKPDILIVPGGHVQGPIDSATTIDWIRKTGENATYVMSVCNGAFILAKAGLLDGKSATTFYGMIDDLAQAAPHTKVVRDQRWVDNGKVITTAGLSSGIDGSLHLISKVRGMARAKAVALNLEYDWDPDSDFARAALADQRFPSLELPDGVKLELISTDGTREWWTQSYEARGPLSPAELAASLAGQVKNQAEWKPVSSKAAKGDLERSWTTVDRDGGSWTFTAGVEADANGAGPAVVTLHIEKTRQADSAAR